MSKILRIVAVIDILLLMFIGWMLMEARGEYVIAENGLRIRSEPSTEAEIVTVVPYGEQVFGEVEAGWMRLEGRDGYVCADFVSVDDPMEGMELLGTWRVTAYTWTGYPCANGNYPSDGYTIACNSLDFGEQVYIDGIGFRTVEDRGPAWLGSEWCDVYMSSYDGCVRWGSQQRKIWRITND